MDHYFPKKLRKIYESGTNQGLLFKDPEQTNIDFQKLLNSLEVLGYINVISHSLGGAEIELTPQGIEFCEQIDNVTD